MLARNHIDSIKYILAGWLALLCLSSCAWLLKEYDETEGWSVTRFYSEAKEAVSDSNYERAINLYEKLQARYPFGRYAQQAQLELIYVYYKSEEPDSAIAAADRFIRTYPRHPFVDYAYYMKGLVNFHRESGTMARVIPSDPAKTDTGAAQESYNDFAELVRKFPNSKYTRDASQRMLFLHNTLAAYEVNVAKYYMRRKAYVAAANRASHVLENYARTPAVPEALALLTEAYKKMGMNDLATDSYRVLTLNFPDSPYVRGLEQENSSFLSWFGLGS
jgi:outer membrane protein assembly factor BamD